MKRTLKGLRTDLGLTQIEMAKKLGVSIATYQRYENYVYKIPSAVLVKIADMVNIVDVRDIKFEA